MVLNFDDFNLERILNEEMIPTSNEMDKLFSEIEGVLASRSICGISADPGSGVDLVFAQIKKKYDRQVYLLNCQGKELSFLYGDLMISLGFSTKLVNWHTANYANILEALTYYLKSINFRPLIIINNCDYLKNKDFLEFIETLLQIKGQTGIVFRVSIRKSKTILNNPDRNFRSKIQQLKWTDLSYPTPEIVLAYVMECGVIGGKVLKDLTKDNPDYEIIDHRLKLIRTEIKKVLKKTKP